MHIILFKVPLLVLFMVILCSLITLSILLFSGADNIRKAKAIYYSFISFGYG